MLLYLLYAFKVVLPTLKVFLIPLCSANFQHPLLAIRGISFMLYCLLESQWSDTDEPSRMERALQCKSQAHIWTRSTTFWENTRSLTSVFTTSLHFNFLDSKCFVMFSGLEKNNKHLDLACNLVMIPTWQCLGSTASSGACSQLPTSADLPRQQGQFKQWGSCCSGTGPGSARVVVGIGGGKQRVSLSSHTGLRVHLRVGLQCWLHMDCKLGEKGDDHVPLMPPPRTTDHLCVWDARRLGTNWILGN